MLLSRSIKSSAVSIPEFSTYPPSTRRACGLAVIQSFRKETVAARHPWKPRAGEGRSAKRDPQRVTLDSLIGSGAGTIKHRENTEVFVFGVERVDIKGRDDNAFAATGICRVQQQRRHIVGRCPM